MFEKAWSRFNLVKEGSPVSTSPQLLLYSRPVRLNRVTHAKLRFSPLTSFNFARKVTAIPLMGVEFPIACRQYPIVFIKSPDGKIGAQGVLSLAEGVNSFVDPKGRWTSTYVPAFIRRYPFVLAEIPGKTDDYDVAFDEASNCFSSKEGEALFNDQGAPTPFLQAQIDFLQRFQAEHQRTQQFLETLKEDGLLTPYNVNIVRGGDQAKFAVRNAMVVDESKLAGLSTEHAAAYMQSGYFAMIYAHLISLQSFLSVANRTGDPAAEVAPWWAK
jgi:hypothetical protein